MLVAIGHSVNVDLDDALQEILAQCRETLGSRGPGLGILFTSRMDADFQAILDCIQAKWPEMALVGCTTDGEISDRYPCVEESLGLLLIHSERIKFATGWGLNLSDDPEGALRQAFTQASRQTAQEPALGVILCEGLKTFGVDMQRALDRVLDQRLPIFGAYAGDCFQFRSTFQFHGTRVLTDAAVVILGFGPIRFSMELGGGWSPIGASFPVSTYKGNVVWEIDGMTARDFFRKYLGPNSRGYAQFPLAVSVGDEDDFMLRDPIDVNEQDGSATFVGTFPDNARVRLTEFSRDSLLQAAEQTIDQALKTYPGCSPALALLCPCTSRRHILGSRAGLEHDRLRMAGANQPGPRFFGMYAYGEIGPLGKEGGTCLHNDTYAVLLLGDEP